MQNPHDPSVTSNRPGILRRLAAPAVIAVGLVSTVGCRTADVTLASSAAHSTTNSAPHRVAGPSGGLSSADGMYCQDVAGHETPLRPGLTSDQLRAVWTQRRQYENAAVVTSSGSALTAWRTIEHYTRNVATNALEATSYSPSSLPSEPAAVTAARASVARYDHNICGVS